MAEQAKQNNGGEGEGEGWFASLGTRSSPIWTIPFLAFGRRLIPRGLFASPLVPLRSLRISALMFCANNGGGKTYEERMSGDMNNVFCCVMQDESDILSFGNSPTVIENASGTYDSCLLCTLTFPPSVCLKM